MVPAFQVAHSFQLASQSTPPTYSFGALFTNPKVLLQGNVDHEGNVFGRFQQSWSVSNTSKMQVQHRSSLQGSAVLSFGSKRIVALGPSLEQSSCDRAQFHVQRIPGCIHEPLESEVPITCLACITLYTAQLDSPAQVLDQDRERRPTAMHSRFHPKAMAVSRPIRNGLHNPHTCGRSLTLTGT